MPFHKAQKKSLRQNIKKNIANTSVRSSLKTALKKVEEAISKKEKAKAKEYFIEAQILLDKAGQKNLVDIKKAARNKSRLMTRINALS